MNTLKPIIKEAAVLIENFFDDVADFLQKEPLSIDKIAEKMSKSTDRIILNATQKENLSFLGGYLHAIATEGNNSKIRLELKLYFKNSDGKNVIKETSSQIDSARVEENSLKELLSLKKISFPVSAPHSGTGAV